MSNICSHVNGYLWVGDPRVYRESVDDGFSTFNLDDVEPSLIAEALELALVTARKDASTVDAPAPPRSIRPFLRFDRIPQRALSPLAAALHTDAEFRARVAGSVQPEALDQASHLFLERPSGWEEELSTIAEESRRASNKRDEQAAELDAVRKVDMLSESLERSRAQVDEMRRDLQAAEAALDSERSERNLLAAERKVLSESLEAAKAERAETVRQLKAAEALATDRLEQLQASRENEPPHGSDEAESKESRAREMLRRAEKASTSARRIAQTLEETAATIRAEADLPSPKQFPAQNQAAQNQTSEKRLPVRLGRGLVDDSVLGLNELLAVKGIVVFVDGYNVSKTAWRHLTIGEQREQLVHLLGTVKGRFVVEIHVVFDGDVDGARPQVSTPYPVRVHFTPEGIEADDRILEFVDGLPASAPVLVATSDQRVRDGARSRGANVVSSQVLLDVARSR